ncbi:glycosyltransferase family 2 protein [Hymenobacter guriensis]|uniref:Glycosyltransferase n=1 Tax=Hymenobacter guriensis TaxID=2793065 RepID=A0ABS0L0R1_9BACT|nr:glycosyltransferase [Hymenobacter guriensis]MBG8553653.1 glycosyltransferase [Hymenobacter guriensis]
MTNDAPSVLSAVPELPLVTVVALCYNHARFLRPALDSILVQTYPRLEVILVDDASTDDSATILREYANAHPSWQLLLLPRNEGNCAAFNHAFRRSQGEFLIDFATDDVLLPERIARQVAVFQQLPPSYGLVYSDAEHVDEQGHHVGYHYKRPRPGVLLPRPAEGWVFAEVLRRYFISSPTVLVRRAVLAELGGYDETLTYEDFDFWVRAARNWQFHFQDEKTTQKRLHPQAMSRRGYRPHDPYLASTIRICRKARALCRTPDEQDALAVRVRWELRQAVRWRNFSEARELYGLLRELQAVRPLDWLLSQAAGIGALLSS